MSEFFYEHSILLLIAGIFVILFLIMIIASFSALKLKKKLSVSKQEIEKINAEYRQLKQIHKDTLSSYYALSSRYEELYKSNENVKKLAYTDYLTELPNRTAFIEMLDNIMVTLRKDEIIGIMDIDVDNFKIINDTLGHSYGDEMLIDVAHRIKQVLDENDYLARFGGDEFMILTQNIEDMASYEEKINKVKNVFANPFVLSTKEYFVSVSIGVAFAPKDGKTSQTLIKNVDSAMYMAKVKGKNTHVYFEQSYNQMLTDKIEMQSELRKAIENEEFVLYYQAQMDISRKKIIGFEALLRWNHPYKGLLYPVDFIYLAEESGLIVPIGKWVLTQACKQLKEWTDMGYTDIDMAVNLSARQFKDENFVRMVKDIIEETGIDPNRLELEITESVALENFEYTIDVIKELNKLGVKFSLDDFGTGYSAMSYLKHLPINNLKIDKSFLNTILEDTTDQKIIQAIINLANNLNLHVIAEGVEQREHEHLLQEMNCNMAQGYLYSKPVPKDKAEELLSNKNFLR